MCDKSFPYYIEDWILWAGRFKDSRGNDIDFSFYVPYPLKLANYDVPFVNRSCADIRNGIGFTDKQLKLAATIIAKYRKQILQKLSKDVAYLASNVPNRLPIREVNRRYSVESVGNTWEVRFPYKSFQVDMLYEMSKARGGKFHWDNSKRKWVIDKTEKNLSLLRKFINEHSNYAWQIDSQLINLFDQVDDVLKNTNNYIPLLDLSDSDEPMVFNASESLTVALEKFDLTQDLANVAFRADCYGIRVGPVLQKKLYTEHSNIAKVLCSAQSEISRSSKVLTAVLDSNNIPELMETVSSDYWVFLDFSTDGTQFKQHLRNIQTNAELLFYHVKSKFKLDCALTEISSLGSNEIVVITNSGILTNRVIDMLQSVDTLRIIYTYGDDES